MIQWMKCDIKYEINFLSIEYEINVLPYVRNNMWYYERGVVIQRVDLFRIQVVYEL